LGDDPELQVVMSTDFKYTLLLYHFEMPDELRLLPDVFEAFAEKTGNRKVKEGLELIKRRL